MGKDDAKQVGCRLNSANQQKDGHVEHFALRQVLAVHFGFNEGTDQVAAAWICHPLIIDFLEIGTDRLGASIDLRQPFRRVGRTISGREQIIDPMLEIEPLCAVDTKHIGDHADRKKPRKFPDKVEFALGPVLGENIIDQRPGCLGDVAAQRPHPARHERLVRKAPDSHMPRRVERDHRRHFRHGIVFAKQGWPKLSGGVCFSVTQQVGDILPARYGETLHLLKPFYRLIRAQLGIMRIGVGRDSGIKRVVCHAGITPSCCSTGIASQMLRSR